MHESVRSHLLLASALASFGAAGCACDCYSSYRVGAGDDAGGDDDDDDGGGPDGGRDSGPDASQWWDTGVPPDLPDAQVPCHTEPHIDPFEAPAPEYIWAAGDEGQPLPQYTQVCATPIVVDIDPVGDGEIWPEVVFMSYEDINWASAEQGVLRAVDVTTGESKFTVPGPDDDPVQFNLEATATPAAGDLDGDGIPEIVAIGAIYGLYAYHADGTEMWRAPDPTLLERSWRNEGDTHFKMISGALAIADLEGDGFPEVVFGRLVVDGIDGGQRWIGEDANCNPGLAEEILCKGMNEGLGPISCVADLDEDGFAEVIAGPAVYEHDGTLRFKAEGQDGFCAVADVITDPGAEGPEVIVVAAGTLRLFDKDTGETLWEKGVPGAVRGMPIGGPPTVANFDGDARQEIGVAQGASYTVFDLDCDASVPAGCIEEGVRWVVTTEDDSSSATGSSVFDFNGDGVAEVIYNDEEFFRVYRGTDGFELFSEGSSSRTRTENPVIADVDNDGNAEIVFPSNNEARFLDPVSNAGFEVWGDPFDRWVGARRIWNQHTYHIDNVEEDGRIPVVEPPSWNALNSYRQNLAEDPEEVLAAPDLRVRSWFECTPEGALITILVRNRGGTPVDPGVVIGIYDGNNRLGGERIGEVVTTLRLGPNDGEELTFLWEDPPSLPDTAEVWINVDELDDSPDGTVRECYEGNNRSRLEDVGC